MCHRCATCVTGSAVVHKLSGCAQAQRLCTSSAVVHKLSGCAQAQRLCTSSAVAHDTGTAPRMELQPAGSNCLDYVHRAKPARRINKLVQNRACMYCHTCQVRAARNWGAATSTTTALYRRYGTRWTYATRRFDCKALHRSTSSWNVLMPGSN